MEVDGKYVKFGCYKFSESTLRQLNLSVLSFKSLLNSNREIKSITLDSGVEITVEQLEQVVNELNK